MQRRRRLVGVAQSFAGDGGGGGAGEVARSLTRAGSRVLIGTGEA